MDDPRKTATPPLSVTPASARIGPSGTDTAKTDTVKTDTVKTRQPDQPKENIKETIESILVAFILAFVFRAFIVEAFVIPSGSMAPTLLGGHMRYRCEDCGYGFNVNYPSDTSREDLSIPSMSGPTAVNREVRGPNGETFIQQELKNTEFSVHCPNCGFKVRKDNPDPRQSATNTPVNYGDRILVLKYLYLLDEPKRWDVVVFKSPTEARRDFNQNFIKRLVGKPGEMLMILDGDVYTTYNSGQAPVAVENSPWEVQAKPRVVQEALWRVICDNDYLPQNSAARTRSMAPWRSPWRAQGQGWDTGAAERPSRVFRFKGQEEGKLAFDKDANSGTYPFTDWLPYDETMPFQPAASSRYDFEAYAGEHVPRWNVSDVKIQFTYQRKEGQGPLRVVMTKLDDKFTAELLPGKAKLYRQEGTRPEYLIREVALPDGGGRPVAVEFANADYQVTLRVDGKDVIKTTPRDYRPNLRRVLALHRQRMKLIDSGADRQQARDVFPQPKVELSAAGQACEIAHLSLWRDVYYTPTTGSAEILQGSPDHPVRLAADGQGKENEYFVLGDNSVLSHDARFWREIVDLRSSDDMYADAGRVPERFMLGRAFFVYWPAGYRPLSPTAPGVIPNFGDMRFIH